MSTSTTIAMRQLFLCETCKDDWEREFKPEFGEPVTIEKVDATIFECFECGLKKTREDRFRINLYSSVTARLQHEAHLEQMAINTYQGAQ